ncbi:MAG: flagellar FliJ family protein [Candidatus Kapabacteria bacterium]|nr:flagellar FliJ family protein [Candidatus Kapabacteria bacterium]
MAKRFSFRLESVLKIRTHKAELAKEELNKVIAYKLEKERKKDNFIVEIKTTIQKSKRTSIADFQANYQYKSFLEEEIKKLEGEILRILEIEVIRRTALAEALKDQKVIEKLKEKKQEDYRLEMNQLDAIFFDELAINRFDKVETYFR